MNEPPERGRLPYLEEPPRRTPIVAEADVLVAGGGAAGVAAAVAAARNGARTILVERYGYAGGLATGGLIILLLTLDDGRGQQVTAGLCQELVDRLDVAGAAYYPPRGQWGSDDPALVEHCRRWGLVWGSPPHTVRYSVAYDPEAFKRCADDLLQEAGVELRYHTWAAEALVDDDTISHVIVQSKAGRGAIRTRMVIDATGDGDLFASAGEPFELERVHPWLWFRMANVDTAHMQGSGRDVGYQTLGEGHVLIPWGGQGRIDRRIDATDPLELTHAEVECRRLAEREARRLIQTEPGFEHAYLTDVATQLGITESRRLLGRRVLGREQIDVRFPDTVARCGHWTKYGAVYDIPYGCLLPPRISNLLVAGRCISVDHRAHHATKEIPPCFATGEAAGTAAALAARAGLSAPAVGVIELRRQLTRQGAIV